MFYEYESDNVTAMRDNEGFEILHNGVPRSFRDVRGTAYEAGRFTKSRARGEIVEIIDRSTGAKLLNPSPALNEFRERPL